MLQDRSHKLMEMYFPTLRNAPLVRPRAFSSGLWRLSDVGSVSFVISPPPPPAPLRPADGIARFGRWLAAEKAQRCGRSLATFRDRGLYPRIRRIDVNLRFGHNGVSSHLRRRSRSWEIVAMYYRRSSCSSLASSWEIVAMY